MYSVPFFRRFLPLISQDFMYQMLIQVINLSAGFFIVRMLDYKEYACYTIANTFLGMMTVISDGGITSGVMAHGGKTWKDRGALGNIFSTAYQLRIRMASISLIISIPFLWWLLQKQNISFFNSLLISSCLIPIFFSSLSDNLLQVPLKLHQQVASIQKNSFVVSVTRLFFLGVALFLLPFTWIILIITGITRLYGNLALRRLNKTLIKQTGESDPAVRKMLLRHMYRLLPGTIYYCFSGQIAIWLMSYMGNNTSVASLGALSRFSLIFSIFTVVFGNVATPRFSRIQDNPQLLRKKFLFLQQIILLGFGIILLTFYFFSDPLLMILGEAYQHLHKELIWSISASLLGIASGFSFSLFTARGWSMFPLTPIMVNLLSLIAGITFFEINTLMGVLMMNTFVNLIQYGMNTLFCLYKIQKSLLH